MFGVINSYDGRVQETAIITHTRNNFVFSFNFLVKKMHYTYGFENN